MKKIRKLQLAALLMGVSAAFAGFAAMNVEVQANAEETGSFSMQTGASIRTTPESSGMRWITTVSESWYNAKVPSGAKAEFGTFVTSADNVSSIEELDENFNKEKKDIVCPSKAKFEEGEFTYYSSVIYNKVATEKQKEAYAEELIARSYVRYSTDNGSSWTYVYADTEDSLRCIRVVAATTILDEEGFASLTDEEKSAVQSYVGENAGNLVEDGYLERADGDTFDPSSYDAVYENYKEISEAKTEFALGEHCDYLFFNANGNFATACFQYVDKAAKNEAEFQQIFCASEAVTIEEAYYAIGDDITLEGTWKNMMTFTGILDGDGHTISGLSVNKNTGLFAAVSDATIKNLSVKDAVLAGSMTGVFAYENNGDVTFENVYVSIAETTFGKYYTNQEQTSNPVFVLDQAYGKGGLLARSSQEVTVKESVVYMPEFLPKAHGFVVGYADNATINVTGCTFIGGNGNIYGELNGNSATVAKDNKTSVCDATKAYKALYGNDFDASVKENSNGWSDMQIAAYEENHPLMVLTASNMADLINATSEIVVLTENLDLKNAPVTFFGVESYFKGVFDGQNHSIVNIDITTKKSGGLFDGLAGSVKNVYLEGICGNSASGGGGLVADHMRKTAHVENVLLKPKFICGIPASVCRIVGSDAKTSHDSLSMKDVVIVIQRFIEENPKDEFWDHAIGAVVANGVMINHGATSSMGIYMENCHCVAPEVRPMASRGENSEFELLSSTYGNDKYFFWDVGDSVGGTVMTEDDGLTWHVFPLAELFDQKLQAFNAQVQANKIKLSDFLKERLNAVTSVQ